MLYPVLFFPDITHCYRCKNENKRVCFSLRIICVGSEDLTDLATVGSIIPVGFSNGFHKCWFPATLTHVNRPIKVNSFAGYSQLKHS